MPDPVRPPSIVHDIIREVTGQVLERLLPSQGPALSREAQEYATDIRRIDDLNRRMMKQLARVSSNLEQLEAQVEAIREPLLTLADYGDIGDAALRQWREEGGVDMLRLAQIYADLSIQTEKEAGEGEEGEEDLGADDDEDEDVRPRRG